MRAQATGFVLGALAVLTGCAPAVRVPPPASAPADAVKLIGTTSLGADAQMAGLRIGGVSGIDFDPASRRWYMISDDRSEHGPARFWTLQIAYDAGRAPVVDILAVHPILTGAGTAFPAPGTGQEASDAESVRFSPRDGLLVWSSEGDARDGFGPAVRRMDTNGTAQGALPLPRSLARSPDASRGPRPNLSIEGLTFATDNHALWASMEAPLLQDGPLPDRAHGALARLSRLAYPSGRLLGQYAYPLDPIGPYPTGRLADNGISEILSLDPDHLLVLERSGIQQGDGDFHYRARLYCASWRGASDVAALRSLHGATTRPMRKSLVVDLAQVLPGPVDNVEGMALGPMLPDGHASLVLVTDNNFSPRHQTQFTALEIEAGQSRKAITAALCKRT